MVDADRVARLLRSITDELWMRGVTYVFVTAIGACVDVDDRIVLARLDYPSDLGAFVSAVAGWVPHR